MNTLGDKLVRSSLDDIVDPPIGIIHHRRYADSTWASPPPKAMAGDPAESTSQLLTSLSPSVFNIFCSFQKFWKVLVMLLTFQVFSDLILSRVTVPAASQETRIPLPSAPRLTRIPLWMLLENIALAKSSREFYDFSTWVCHRRE